MMKFVQDTMYCAASLNPFQWDEKHVRDLKQEMFQRLRRTVQAQSLTDYLRVLLTAFYSHPADATIAHFLVNLSDTLAKVHGETVAQRHLDMVFADIEGMGEYGIDELARTIGDSCEDLLVGKCEMPEEIAA